MEFKQMKSKFGGFCTKCSQNFPEGTLIKYYFDSKTAEHVRCTPTAPAPAGASEAKPRPKNPKKRDDVPLQKPDVPAPSPFKEQQYAVFRFQVLPEWASIMAKHRIDITLWDDAGKKEVLKMFREYWDSNPPF